MNLHNFQVSLAIVGSAADIEVHSCSNEVMWLVSAVVYFTYRSMKNYDCSSFCHFVTM